MATGTGRTGEQPVGYVAGEDPSRWRAPGRANRDQVGTRFERGMLKRRGDRAPADDERVALGPVVEHLVDLLGDRFRGLSQESLGVAAGQQAGDVGVGVDVDDDQPTSRLGENLPEGESVTRALGPVDSHEDAAHAGATLEHGTFPSRRRRAARLGRSTAGGRERRALRQIAPRRGVLVSLAERSGVRAGGGIAAGLERAGGGGQSQHGAAITASEAPVEICCTEPACRCP